MTDPLSNEKKKLKKLPKGFISLIIKTTTKQNTRQNQYIFLFLPLNVSGLMKLLTEDRHAI